jgi:hypothetical protein
MSWITPRVALTIPAAEPTTVAMVTVSPIWARSLARTAKPSGE